MNTDKIYAEHIANEYAPKNTTKVNQLKKLDAKAKRSATIFTYSFGVICTLILGTGMSLAMVVLASGIVAMVAGVVVGIFGIVGCSINYPIYKKLLAKGKTKYGSDIMKLAKEISEEE